MIILEKLNRKSATPPPPPPPQPFFKKMREAIKIYFPGLNYVYIHSYQKSKKSQEKGGCKNCYRVGGILRGDSAGNGGDHVSLGIFLAWVWQI